MMPVGAAAKTGTERAMPATRWAKASRTVEFHAGTCSPRYRMIFSNRLVALAFSGHTSRASRYTLLYASALGFVRATAESH